VRKYDLEKLKKAATCKKVALGFTKPGDSVLTEF